MYIVLYKTVLLLNVFDLERDQLQIRKTGNTKILWFY